MAGWGHFDRHFAIWAERNGYEMDYASMHDVYDNPDFLEPYDLIDQVGHDEYLTFEYHQVVDAHLARGGKPSAYPKSSPVRQEIAEHGRSNLSGSCRLRARSPHLSHSVRNQDDHTRQMTGSRTKQSLGSSAE